MAEKNYTIPVNEIFEVVDGCPLCRMQTMLEQRCVEYITGAAMMEPDIRIKTNEQGFCSVHFSKMMDMRKSLPVALIMESHLLHINKELIHKKPGRKGDSAISDMINSCYVCSKIEWALDTMIDTICKLWKENSGFREIYTSQDHLCLYHFDTINIKSQKLLKKDDLKTFSQVNFDLAKKHLDELCKDVSHFCKMYDYRNATENADWGNSKGSVERSIEFLNKK